MRPLDKCERPELVLKAVYRQVVIDGKKVGRWRIYVVTAAGRYAALGGWESVLFKTHSKCVEAIHFIQEQGGSYQAFHVDHR